MTEPQNQHVRDWLLEAELSELRDPPAAVRAHLNVCIACERERKQVLAAYVQLDSGLAQLVQPARRRRWAWGALPLAAAAVLAALVLTRRESPPPAAPAPVLAQLLFSDEPVVTPAAGQDAVVMEKNDLTVIWLTNSRGKQ